MKIVRLLFLFVLIFSSCKKSVERSPASASSLEGLPIKWAESVVVNNAGLSIKISNTVNSLFGGSSNLIDAISNQWNNADSKHNFINTPHQILTNNLTYTTTEQYRDNELGVYTNANWFSTVSSSALAVTLFSGVKRNSGTSNEFLELIHADIIINTKDFKFSPQVNSIRNAASTNQMQNSYDIQSILLHELGHFLGMSHQFNNSIPSVMQTSLNFSQEKRILQQYDIDKISSTYAMDTKSQTSSLLTLDITTAPSTNDSFSMPIDESLDNPEVFVGQMELMADGQCRLFINGKLIKIFK